MTQELSVKWTFPGKIGFRFLFIFFTLYILPFPISSLPWVKVYPLYSKIWPPIVAFVGEVFFSLTEMANTSNGSGDHLYDYVHYFTFLLFAGIGALLWTIIDRKRDNYLVLQKWFIIILAFYLSSILLSYGFSKVFYMQFRPPGPGQLIQTYGQSSPMKLAWIFMGSSEIYTKFSGWSEVVAGLFLFYNRTRILGGLMCFGVMLNVFLLNMSYDIPVKLYSFTLMIMGLYIALSQGKRLFNFFILNKQASLAKLEVPVSNQTGKYLMIGLQLLFVTYLIYTQVNSKLESKKTYSQYFEEPPLYGVYKVNDYTRNGETVLPLVTDSLYMKLIFIDKQYGGIKTLSGKQVNYRHKIDTIQKQINFTSYRDSTDITTFDYQLIDKNLLIKGIYEGDTISADLEYYDPKESLLIKRGFNWVNETPYNTYDRKGLNP